jgi:DNA-binding response OmpR family regulator
MRTASILIVDDDAQFRAALAEHLALYGCFDTNVAGSGAEALATLDESVPDIILLDVHLPDMDGRDLCRLFRNRGIDAPIILVTGESTDADIVLGLNAGAHDYLIKPFGFGVLIARIRVLLRGQVKAC